jgi:hypothetical protein
VSWVKSLDKSNTACLQRIQKSTQRRKDAGKKKRGFFASLRLGDQSFFTLLSHVTPRAAARIRADGNRPLLHLPQNRHSDFG